MKVSTKGRYAIRIMLDLAEHGDGEFTSLKDISERQEITVKYMEQIISVLNRAGFVRSARGSGGGYRLAKEAKEYTIGSILRAMEGDLVPVSCLEDEQNQCRRAKRCVTLSFWKGLDKTVNEYVDSFTLEDLLEEDTQPL